MDAARASYFGVHQLPELIRQYQADARVDELDDQGRTPLFYAQTVEEARFLVLAGIDPDHRDRTGTPATYQVGPTVGRYLVHGPRASYFGAHDPVFLSMNQRAEADPNERDELGRTPLFYVQSIPEAEFLIRHGADPLAVDNTGATPLFTVPGGTGVVDFLVKTHHLDPNAKDIDGNSVLHLTQDVELLKDALEVGTAPLIVNRAGQNAVEHRLQGGAAGGGASPSQNLKKKQQAGWDGVPGSEGLIMQILRGIFGALTEAIGVRTHRR